MASIVTRTREDGKRSYHVKYKDGAGQIRWEHVPGDKRAANARKRDIETNLHKNARWTPPKPTKVDEHADHWLSVIKHEVTPRVYEELRSRVSARVETRARKARTRRGHVRAHRADRDQDVRRGEGTRHRA